MSGGRRGRGDRDRWGREDKTPVVRDKVAASNFEGEGCKELVAGMVVGNLCQYEEGMGR